MRVNLYLNWNLKMGIIERERKRERERYCRHKILNSPVRQWDRHYSQRVDTLNCSGRAIHPSATVKTHTDIFIADSSFHWQTKSFRDRRLIPPSPHRCPLCSSPSYQSILNLSVQSTLHSKYVKCPPPNDQTITTKCQERKGKKKMIESAEKNKK